MLTTQEKHGKQLKFVMSKPTPFDYVESIYTKQPVRSMAGFNPYLCCWSLSNNLDTCLLGNEMNRYPSLPPEAQFEFLFHSVTKGKRWGKWNKPQEHPHLELVMEYFQYNKQKALEALTVLTQQDIKAIIELQDKGGR